jgi:hypothetical protein
MSSFDKTFRFFFYFNGSFCVRAIVRVNVFTRAALGPVFNKIHEFIISESRSVFMTMSEYLSAFQIFKIN